MRRKSEFSTCQRNRFVGGTILPAHSLSCLYFFTIFSHRIGNFGLFVGEQTHATKCKADAALLDRNMKLQKEAFGTEIFEKVVMEAETLSGLKAFMTAAHDKEVHAAIEAAKQQVAVPINKKEMKQREIENLDRA